MKNIYDLWCCNDSINFDGIIIPTSLPVEKCGVRKISKPKYIEKTLLWKAYHFKRRLFGSDFIGRQVGIRINRYCNSGNILLDVGCGNMRLQRYVPEDAFYYAFDISVDEWNLKRISKIKNASFALASAANIPLSDSVVDIVICTEVLYCIPDYEQVIEEVHRVLKLGGLLLISIPNSFCHKYQVKGPNPDCCNSWTYEEFLNIAKRNGFDIVEGLMIGRWIKLPPWLTKKNFQLPYSSVKEFYNTNFLYVFRCCK